MPQTIGPATGGLWQDYLAGTDQDSIRQQIINAIGLRLTQILTANGYRTDLGQHVFLYRPDSATYGPSELPAINYKDTDASPQEDGSIGQFRWRLNFELRVKVAAGTTSPSEARKMIHDINNAIGRDSGQWNGLANSTTQPTDFITIGQQEDQVLEILITFAVAYDTPTWEI